MAKQTLMWTALPNGYTDDGRGLRVSLLLSPRLDPEGGKGVLKTFFPDFLEWPQMLAGSDTLFTITYGGQHVKIAGDQLAGASRVDDHYFGAAFGPAFGWGDATLWQELFTAATPVQKFEYQDLSNHQVLSYDTRAVHDVVRTLYRRLAGTAGDAMPTIGKYLGDPGWKPLVEVARQLDDRPRQHDTRDRPQFVNQETSLRDPGRMYAAFAKDHLTFKDPLLRRLARFELFNTPMMRPKPVVGRTRRDDPRIAANWLEYEKSALPKPEEFAKKIDFHQMVAAMNSYPVLLRKLGLVVDLIVDRSLFTFAADAALSAQVTLPKTGGSATRVDVSPVTHAKFDKAHWQAARQPSPKAGDSRVRDGLLELDPRQFDLVQVDVDGAGIKLMNFARSLLRHSEKEDLRFDPTTRKENEAGVPALRNAGLMLTHHNRWSMLKNRFTDNKKKNDAAEKIAKAPPKAKLPPPEFWAEDLVRGYRIDIRDTKSGKWRSLCERNAEYRIGGAVLSGIAEEGIVRLAATQPVDATVVPNLTKLHEAVVSWNGWSLAARQPGLAIPPDDRIGATNPAESAPTLPPGLNFTSQFVAKSGSLPRLRYGREYALRARVVDLAGNSLKPDEDDIGVSSTQTLPQTYLRYEPMMPPAIALVQPAPDEKPLIPQEGESMERIAIRSFNDTQADNAILSTATAERYAVPVQVSIRDAELHGALDTSGAIDPNRYTTLVDKDSPLAEFKLPMQGPTDPAPVDTSFAVLEIGSELRYLPDPMAVFVAARLFDHPSIGPEKVVGIRLYPNSRRWPDAQAIRIHCYEDASPTAAPKVSETASGMLLRVPLQKSARVQLRLSTMLSKNGLEKLGVWQWLLNSSEWTALPAAEKDALLKRALEGQHWMLSPWRTIELVHAVQRPLLTPDFPKHNAKTLFKFASRTRGDTFVWPIFIHATHIASTERLDLLAEWHEPAVTPSGPSDRLRSDRAFSVRLTTPQTYEPESAKTPGGGEPEHDILPPGAITVSAGAAEGGVVPPDLIGVPPVRAALELAHVSTGKEPRSVRRLVHEFHDTRYRRIAYWTVGTTRFREYLPHDLLVDAGEPTERNISISVDSSVPRQPRHVTWVPSSAAPPAPSVLYVVPTFGWVEGETVDGRVTRWRRGGGLRVYLDQPWNTSGYGEMLAVVLPPSGFKGDPNLEPVPSTYKKVITQWGNDPAWDSPFVAGLAPKRSNFPLARWKPDPTGAWLPPGAVIDADWNEADQQPGDFAVTALKPAGLDDPAPDVEIAPHDVYFDNERQLWFCDIEIQAGASYYPFVRLALARYQPCAIFEAHLSNIVLADFMALTPDRSLSVAPTRSAHGRRVTVYGDRPRQSAGFAEASRSPALTRIDLATGNRREERPADIAKTPVIEVWVERLTPAQGLDFGWHRVHDAVVTPIRPLLSTTKPGARQRTRALELVKAQRYAELANEGLIAVLMRATLWDGTVTLSGAPAPDAQYRIVIAEYEEYLTDDVPSPGFPNVAYDTPPESKGRRLVFVEHIELDFG